VWCERGARSAFPRQALAAVTTHDLPTIAGVWNRSDEQADDELRVRLCSLTNLPDDAPVDEMVVATHVELARAPSMIVTATLDDALCVEDRPNLPGTTTERPNWSLALPVPVDELASNPVVARVNGVMATHVD